MHDRAEFRALGRRVYAAPGQATLHAKRLAAALPLEGNEPLQGALADAFRGCLPGQRLAAARMLETARERMTPHLTAAFEAYLDQNAPFPVCSPLATRWSVLTTPSMTVPRRALRCSADDSRRIAAAFVEQQTREPTAEAEQAFLDHCLQCGDTLAFMLARRALVKAGQHPAVATWDDVMNQLPRSGA